MNHDVHDLYAQIYTINNRLFLIFRIWPNAQKENIKNFLLKERWYKFVQLSYTVLYKILFVNISSIHSVRERMNRFTRWVQHQSVKRFYFWFLQSAYCNKHFSLHRVWALPPKTPTSPSQWSHFLLADAVQVIRFRLFRLNSSGKLPEICL